MKNTPYTKEEEEIIFKELNENLSIEQIAKNIQRSASSLTTKLKKIAIDMIKTENLSFIEVSEKVKIPIEIIQQYYSCKVKKTKEEIKNERKIRKEQKKQDKLIIKDVKNIKENKINKYDFKKELKEKKELETIILLKEIRDYLKILVEK
jgi:hypothetical protein